MGSVVGWWLYLWMALAVAGTPASSGEAGLVVGGKAWIFALPAANVDVARQLVQRDIVTLNQLVGLAPIAPSKAVVLFFFKRDNGSEALSVLDRIAARWKNQQVRVLAICADEAPPEDVDAWIEPLGLHYPVLVDNYHLVTERYGVQLTPFVVLVDGQGQVFSIGAPGLSDLENHLDQEIRLLLGK